MSRVFARLIVFVCPVGFVCCWPCVGPDSPHLEQQSRRVADRKQLDTSTDLGPRAKTSSYWDGGGIDRARLHAWLRTEPANRIVLPEPRGGTDS